MIKSLASPLTGQQAVAWAVDKHMNLVEGTLSHDPPFIPSV